MLDPVPMSRTGYNKLMEELDHLQTVELPEVQKTVADAREEGDLKENGAYIYGRQRQGHIVGRISELKGKLNGHDIRVPLANASLTDCVFEVARATSVAEVNGLLKDAADGELAGILGYEERPLVSTDYKTDFDKASKDFWQRETQKGLMKYNGGSLTGNFGRDTYTLEELLARMGNFIKEAISSELLDKKIPPAELAENFKAIDVSLKLLATTVEKMDDKIDIVNIACLCYGIKAADPHIRAYPQITLFIFKYPVNGFVRQSVIFMKDLNTLGIPCIIQVDFH